MFEAGNEHSHLDLRRFLPLIKRFTGGRLSEKGVLSRPMRAAVDCSARIKSGPESLESNGCPGARRALINRIIGRTRRRREQNSRIFQALLYRWSRITFDIVHDDDIYWPHQSWSEMRVLAGHLVDVEWTRRGQTAGVNRIDSFPLRLRCKLRGVVGILNCLESR
jgi:hypothetical protein